MWNWSAWDLYQVDFESFYHFQLIKITLLFYPFHHKLISTTQIVGWDFLGTLTILFKGLQLLSMDC